MLMSQLRWIAACAAVVAAVVASPARSKADTQILIQEVDAANNPVGSLSTFFQAGNGSFNLPSSFSTPSFNVTSIGATPIIGLDGSGSLSTTVITTPGAAFNPTHSLRVTVTSDGFLNPTPGGVGTLVNDPGISTSRTADANSNTGTTVLLTGPIGSTTPFDPPLILTDTQFTGGSDARSDTTVTAVPGQYTLQQTLKITITPNGSLNGTFTDTLSSSLDATPPPAAVPAPGGLVLGLVALPLLGLRRTLRKRA